MVEVADILDSLASIAPFSESRRDQVSVEPLQTLPHSEVYRIRVDSPDIRFILKVPGPNDAADLARRERRFYREIAPRLPAGLVPECVAQREEGNGSSGWLLIADLSATHSVVGSDSVPSEQQSHSFVAALAALHASTSQMPDVLDAWTRAEGQLRIGTLDDRLALFRANLRPFSDGFGESLDERTLALLDHVLRFDKLSRVRALPKEAIVHGDAHYGNALYAASSTACLIDWGMPMRAFGEIDVAHAVALNLPSSVRRVREAELHQLYLEEMSKHGVSLDADAFRHRYELGVLYALAAPVSWWRSGVPERVWRPALANLVDAAEDLGLCE